MRFFGKAPKRFTYYTADAAGITKKPHTHTGNTAVRLGSPLERFHHIDEVTICRLLDESRYLIWSYVKSKYEINVKNLI